MDRIVNKKDLNFLFEKDKILVEIQSNYGTPPNWQRKEGFQTLCQIILEQQVSLESARAHFQKLDEFLPEFTPTEILKLSDEEIRNCHISRQKSKYLRELSSAIVQRKLNLTELSLLQESEMREELTSIKGIGNWTTDVYLMFCLQFKDIFPMGDIAVVNSIKELYHVKEKEEILRIAETWKPFRSLGTFFMWHHYLNSRNRKAVY